MQTIHIIGDSTVEDGHAPFFGWGGQLLEYLPPGRGVQNYAKGGRSTLSFWNEGRFVPVQAALSPGDLLLIAFGHNDEKDDPALHTDPETTFPQMLARYVDAALEAGAVPVLVTSVSRCYFLNNGELLYTHGEYPRAVRMLAAERGVPLIDMKRKTRALLIALGAKEAEGLFVHVKPGEVEDLPKGWDDQTHFNLRGARKAAQMVAEALSALGLLSKG